MKRRRPCASPSTIIAATALLTAHLWTQTNGIPIFLEEGRGGMIKIIDNPDGPLELNVESPTPGPLGINPSAMNQELDVSYNVVLTTVRDIDIDDLLGSMKTGMEDYVFRSLRALEQDNEDIQIRKVALDVSLLARRAMLRRRRLQDESQDVTVEVDGSIQYDLDEESDNITSEEAESLLEEGLTASLREDKLEEAFIDVKEVLGITGVEIVEERDTDDGSNGDDDGSNAKSSGIGNGSFPSGSTANEDELERPSTLSIAFGFALTGIAFLGLVAYGYIFYRKRQKRLRRKKQMKESIQYHLPSPKVSPAKRSSPHTPARQPPPTTTMNAVTPGKNGDDSSDGSSYDGLESESEAPSDSFARELQQAASLDEQAWEDFQRKKDALGRNEVIRATDVGSAFGQYDSRSQKPKSPGQGSARAGNVAKSFPYGDEIDVEEEGIEWTGGKYSVQRGNDNGNRSLVSTRAEEKKDEWGSDEGQQRQQPLASATTASILESIQRDLAMHGTNIDPEPNREDLTSSDVVLEVERLSRYVKRYEKRKERRSQREHDSRRSNRSSDVSSIPSPPNNDSISTRSTLFDNSLSHQGDRTSGKIPGSRPVAEDISSFRDRDMYHGGYSTNQKENFHLHEKAPYPGGFDHSASPDQRSQLSNPVSSFPDDVTEDTFDYTFQDPDQEGSIRSQRLGITPFDAETEEEPSFNYSAMSPMMQKLAKAEAVRNSAREDFSVPTDETHADRRRRAQSDGEPYTRKSGRLTALRGNAAMLDHTGTVRRLSDLRDNKAIIDSSQSDVQTDVNVAYWEAPQEEGIEIPLSNSRSTDPEPQQPKRATPKNTSRRFNKLRNLFEERQNEAIFPPDQHWQYGVAK